jgi:hypothetical protein
MALHCGTTTMADINPRDRRQVAHCDSRADSTRDTHHSSTAVPTLRDATERTRSFLDHQHYVQSQAVLPLLPYLRFHIDPKPRHLSFFSSYSYTSPSDQEYKQRQPAILDH